MKKNFVWASVAILVTFIVGGVAYAAGIILTSDNKVSEVDKKDVAIMSSQPVQQSTPTPKNTSEKTMLRIAGVDYNLLEEASVYRLINEMSHTKVEAEARNTCVEITSERLDALISAVTKSNWQDKDFLLKNLNMWKNNDFSKSVEFHNYVWEKQTNEKTMLRIAGVDYNLLEESYVYRLINEMSHTKVEAEVRNRYVEITNERVDALISAVTKSNWQDKDFLLKNLSLWKNNDFSKSVEFHNYVWERQGGEIGKATSLKKDDNN
jgi:hypothetical protein